MVRRCRSFWRDDSGISLTEALFVLPILLLVFATFVEFGFAVFQWNQVVKAAQVGARQLAISDVILTSSSAFTDDFGGLTEGSPVPSTVVAVSCGADAAACDTDGMTRLVAGSDGTCNSNLNGSVSGMCDFFPRIAAANTRVTYTRAGLGYVGRPSGPVLSVTVEIRNLTFDFYFLGALLGLDQIAIPAHSVTVTSEDLSSCQDECS